MNETSNFGRGGGGAVVASSNSAQAETVNTTTGGKRSKKAKRPNLMLQLTDEEDRSKPTAGAGPLRPADLMATEPADELGINPGFEESKIFQAVGSSAGGLGSNSQSFGQ